MLACQVAPLPRKFCKVGACFIFNSLRGHALTMLRSLKVILTSRSRSERPASRGHRRINRPCWHYAPNPLKSRPPVKGRHNQTDPLPPAEEGQGGGMQHVRKLTPPQPSPRTACAPQTNMLQRPCRELISIRTPSLHRLSGALGTRMRAIRFASAWDCIERRGGASMTR